MLDDADLDFPEDSSPEPPRSGNRSFLVVAGTLGAIMLLALVGMAVYALVILPQQQAQEEPGLLAAQQTSTAAALGALQATNTNTTAPTATRTATSVPNTATPSNTPTDVAPIFTSVASNTPSGATETVNSLLTQAALAQTQASTVTPASATPGTATVTPTPGSLPESGFAEDFGAPGLLVAAGLLLLVIFAARRLRTAE
jgi:cytoskeletal protein RodZ